MDKTVLRMERVRLDIDNPLGSETLILDWMDEGAKSLPEGSKAG
jgi:hypothetical protein